MSIRIKVSYTQDGNIERITSTPLTHSTEEQAKLLVSQITQNPPDELTYFHKDKALEKGEYKLQHNELSSRPLIITRVLSYRNRYSLL